MTTFSNEPTRPPRFVLVAARFTPDEAAAIDELAKGMPGGRSGVLRAGLDALLAQRAREADQTPGSGGGS